jgi:hypothetical protein
MSFAGFKKGVLKNATADADGSLRGARTKESYRQVRKASQQISVICENLS